jgi:hypothetical protein
VKFCRIILRGKKLTTCQSVTLSNTNPILTGLGLNLGLCVKRLESNQLSDGMDVDLTGISVMYIITLSVSIEMNCQL